MISSRELLEWMRSTDPESRQRAADVVTDVHVSLAEGDAHRLAEGLVEALLVECNQECKEAELFALIQLMSSYAVDPLMLARLEALRPSIEPRLVDYLNALFE
jgi:hypothetical protein